VRGVIKLPKANMLNLKNTFGRGGGDGNSLHRSTESFIKKYADKH
jgi:hypothetical protein